MAKVLEILRVAALLAAEMVGGVAVVGVAQEASRYGFGALFFSIGFSLALVAGALAHRFVFEPAGTYFVPEAVSRLICRSLELPSAFLLIAVYVGVLAVELAASSSILMKAADLSRYLSLVVAMAVIAAPAMGGFRATSLWNLGLLLILILSLGLCFTKSLDTLTFNFSLPEVRILGMWLVLNPLSFVASQPLVQSCKWAEKRGHLMAAVFLAAPVVVLVGFLSASVVVATGACCGRATFAIAAQGLGGSCGLLAPWAVLIAIVTTAPAVLIGASSLLAYVFKRKGDPSGKDAARSFGIPLLVMAALLSFCVKSVAMALSYTLSLRALLALSLIVAAFRRGTCRSCK